MKTLLRAAIAIAGFWPGLAEAAGGAFAVDDAAVESAGVCKVETIAAFSLAANGDRFAVATPACALAFGPYRSEFAVGVSRRREMQTYATPVVVKFKTPLPGLDFSTDGKFGAAFSAGYLTDLDGERRSGYFVTVPASLRVNESILLNANIGRTAFDDGIGSFTTWGAGIEINLKRLGYERITLVAESFSPMRAEVAYQFGARYAPTATIDLDLLFGRNLGGEHKSWLTLGLTRRF